MQASWVLPDSGSLSTAAFISMQQEKLMLLLQDAMCPSAACNTAVLVVCYILHGYELTSMRHH